MSRRGHDVVVVGAGPWGLASAWRSAAAGMRVALVDDGGPPAAGVAAGMLGARSEVDRQDPELLPLLRDALARWPAFSRALAADAGESPGDRYPGAILAASRPEHLEVVRAAGSALVAAEDPAEWLPGSALRRSEPALGPAVAGGLALPEEGEVDPRRLLSALRSACRARGVETVEAEAVGVRRARAGGFLVDLATAGSVPADEVVVAAGHRTSALASGSTLRPVKGQILRLRAEPGLLERTVRTPSVYVVPRSGGEIVVGATVEERADLEVTAGAVLQLLEEAFRVCPDLAETDLVEASAGLRPAAAHGRPLLGRMTPTGPVVASGGYRHGVLLAPLAADAVMEELGGLAASTRGSSTIAGSP